MKTSQSFGVYFTIKKEKAKDNKTNIFACVTVNKEKSFIALKRQVELDHWDCNRRALSKIGD